MLDSRLTFDFLPQVFPSVSRRKRPEYESLRRRRQGSTGKGLGSICPVGQSLLNGRSTRGRYIDALLSRRASGQRSNCLTRSSQPLDISGHSGAVVGLCINIEFMHKSSSRTRRFISTVFALHGSGRGSHLVHVSCSEHSPWVATSAATRPTCRSGISKYLDLGSHLSLGRPSNLRQSMSLGRECTGESCMETCV